MIDLACGCAKPELRAKAIPKIQPKGKRDYAKQPKRPHRASVSQHVPCIANLTERTDANIGPVGNQAEAREELDQVGPLESARFRRQEEAKRQEDATRLAQPRRPALGLGLGNTSVREIVSG